ncbi:hypothetical protein F5Y19DRAFT_237919 [Xylariaceae sp. FL1651]|nr:hypothetical protein F5Y19DRAFT_237919 [Xylariaceae sp. FL1651]
MKVATILATAITTSAAVLALPIHAPETSLNNRNQIPGFDSVAVTPAGNVDVQTREDVTPSGWGADYPSGR